MTSLKWGKQHGLSHWFDAQVKLNNPYKILDKKSNKYLQIISKLETLSPLLTLKRGYTMTKVNDKVVKSSKDLKSGDNITIDFTDGNVDAIVK